MINAIITSINVNFGPYTTTVNPILDENLPLFSTDNTAPLTGADSFTICEAIDAILSSNDEDDNDAQLIETLRTTAIEQVSNFENNDRIIDAIFDCLLRNVLHLQQQNGLDLVTANIRSNDVSILVGDGTGSFDTANNFQVGIEPESVAIGDFNSDGRLDLAVANENSGSVSILLGNGDGTFDPAMNFPVGLSIGIQPRSVTVGDFNGDGILDLATANSNINTVAILLGNGNGTFGPANNFPIVAGSSPRFITVDDFNGDDMLDLATANSISNNVSILLGNGDGTFDPAMNFPVGGITPVSVAIGNFNSDTDRIPDLVVVNANPPASISILLGNGDGTFDPATNFPAGGSLPFDIEVGEFNGDGMLDIAVVNLNSHNVSIFLGNGDGTFGLANNFGVGSFPRSVTRGDFNGDGVFDLATANQGSNNISILLGNDDGTFDPATNFPVRGVEPFDIAVGDFTSTISIPNVQLQQQRTNDILTPTNNNDDDTIIKNIIQQKEEQKLADEQKIQKSNVMSPPSFPKNTIPVGDFD